MTREAGLDTVVDIGAGRGELLTAMRALDPGLDLLGVEVAARPAGLDPAIAWTTALPESVEGLVVANEWLDDIPCHVVEVDADGVVRVVHVDPATGEESLGSALASPSVPASLGAWIERWWPLDGRPPGTRAEVGSTRDAAWADVVGRVRARDRRGGGLRAHRRGPAGPGLACGPTATGTRSTCSPTGRATSPPRSRWTPSRTGSGASYDASATSCATSGSPAPAPTWTSPATDPGGYVAGLSEATEAAELTAAGGLGDFWWVQTVRD